MTSNQRDDYDELESLGGARLPVGYRVAGVLFVVGGTIPCLIIILNIVDEVVGVLKRNNQAQFVEAISYSAIYMIAMGWPLLVIAPQMIFKWMARNRWLRISIVLHVAVYLGTFGFAFANHFLDWSLNQAILCVVMLLLATALIVGSKLEQYYLKRRPNT